MFKILRDVGNYPFDEKLDHELYLRLKERYPKLDLLESIKDWAAYKLDNPLKNKDSPRSQINTFCKKHTEWGRNLKEKNTHPAGVRMEAIK